MLGSFLGSAGIVAVAATALSQEPPRFPAEAEVVRIDAVVVDESGQPVTGLTAADFVLEENGEPRDIASFESIVVRSDEATPEEPLAPSVSAPRALEPRDGRALLIYFDDIHVSPPSAEWVRHNLGPFLERELRPGDAVTIVAPHANFWWTARTPWEHAQLPAVVERLKGQYAKDPFKDERSDWQVMYALETGWDPFNVVWRNQYDQTLWRIRRTLDGLQRAIDSLDGFRGRKSVVVYSEGFILSPQLGEYQWIIDRCRRANIALFVVGAEGLRTGRPTAESRTGGLSVGPAVSPTLGVDVPSTGGAGRLTGWLIDAETAGATHIAVATGGEAFFVNDSTGAVARVLRESTAYYLIGFQPAEGRPGERKLQVRVQRKGLRVRARTRYHWGAPLPRGSEDSAVVVALRAMSDRTAVPFQVRVTAGRAIGGGPVPARLEVEFEPSGSRVRQLKLLIEARPLEKGEIVHDSADLTVPPSDVPLAAGRELPLAPGVWQARVVVTDRETGAMGSVLHTFEVPDEAARGPAD